MLPKASLPAEAGEISTRRATEQRDGLGRQSEQVPQGQETRRRRASRRREPGRVRAAPRPSAARRRTSASGPIAISKTSGSIERPIAGLRTGAPSAAPALPAFIAALSSPVEFLAQIGAEQTLFEDHAVAVIDQDPAWLIGVGQPAGRDDRLLASAEFAARLSFAFLCYRPAPARPDEPDRRGVPASIPPRSLIMGSVCAANTPPPSGVPARAAGRSSWRLYGAVVLQKETGISVCRRSRIKAAGGKPATGRLCRTGPRI